MKYALPKDTSDLLGTTPVENASLLYEKYLLPTDYSASPDEKEHAYKRLTNCKIPFEAQKKGQALSVQIQNTYGRLANTIYADLKSRLAINMGDGLLENAGIALDRNTGAPYIPASSLKGCCRNASYWMQKVGKLPEGFTDKTFGSTNQQGEIIFLPAYAEGPVQIELDILTPHPRNNGRESNPIPNKFPVIKDGARFVFNYIINEGILMNNDIEIIKTLHHSMGLIFEEAFSLGIGAKTAAGMGWFVRDLQYEEDLKLDQERELKVQMEIEEKKNQELFKKETAKKLQQEQESLRILNEKRKAEKEAEKQEAYKNLSPDEQLRIDLTNLSKDEFTKALKGVLDRPETEQRILIEVFLSKNEKNKKKFLKDKKIGPKIKQASTQLGVSL